jgi:predicted esterase
MNFAQWGAAPYDTRDDQKHLAISVDGASGGGNCWNVPADAPKVIAAIDDMAKCFYVHKQKVVIGGFSSGGMLAYALGITQAERFAGILIENSNVPNGIDLSKASWKINIAHRARTGDGAFPIAGVRSQWQKLRAAGFPLETEELPGGHDGESSDWAEWLIPKMASWKAP